MPESTEKLRVKKLSLNEAYNMILQNAITDAISVAAILKIKLLISEGKI